MRAYLRLYDNSKRSSGGLCADGDRAQGTSEVKGAVGGSHAGQGGWMGGWEAG